MENLRYLIYIGPGKPENRNIHIFTPGLTGHFAENLW